MAERNPADLLDDSRSPLVERLRRGFSDLHDRQSRAEEAIGGLQTGQQEAVDSLVSRITIQFSELFTDADIALKAVQTGSFVSAPTATVASLIEGAPLTLMLEPTAPLPFLPSPVVMIGREGSIEDYAIARLDAYDSATRILEVTILVTFGAPGPHDDLYVEIGALSRLAEAENLLRTRDARDEALSATQTAIGAAGTSVQAAETSTAMRQSVQGYALVASNAADRAEEEADRAATFDPENFYLKTETYDQFEVAQVAATARDQAVSLLRGSEEVLDFDEILSRIGQGDNNNAVALGQVVRSLRHANIIVNPGFRISQENGNNQVTATGGYGADQWLLNGTAPGAYLIGAGPISPGLVNSMRTAATAGSSAAGSCGLLQIIEGTRLAALGWQTGTSKATLAFVIRSVYAPRTISVSLRRQDGTASYVQPLALTTALQFFRFVVPAPPAAAGWDYGAAAGLRLSFTNKATAASIAGTAGAWIAGNFHGAPGHQNRDDIEAVFDVAGVVLLPGDVPITAEDLPHLIRSEAEELPICERYYYKRGPSDRRVKFGLVAGFGSNTVLGTGRHPHRMRAVPIMTSGGNGTVRLLPGNIPVSSISFQDISVDDYTFGGGATTTAGASYLMESVNENTAWIAGNARM